MTNLIKHEKHGMSIELEVFLLQDGDDLIVSYCPALELSSYGDTAEDAKTAFDNALKIFLKDTIEKGTFERVLLKLGWTLSTVPKFNFEPPRINPRDLTRMSKSLIQANTTKVAVPYC